MHNHIEHNTVYNQRRFRNFGCTYLEGVGGHNEEEEENVEHQGAQEEAGAAKNKHLVTHSTCHPAISRKLSKVDITNNNLFNCNCL